MLNISPCENSDFVISIDHYNFCITIWVDRVIGKSDLISFPGCIHHVLIVEVEEEAAHVLVVHLAHPVRLVLGEDLAAVLGDYLVLVGKVIDEDPPAGRCELLHVLGAEVVCLGETMHAGTPGIEMSTKFREISQ